MATRTGYFGNPDGDATVALWNEAAWNSSTPTIVTCIKKNASAKYTSPTAKYPNDNQLITLDSDEYVTGISFSGGTITNMHPTDSRQGAFCLCDSNGQAVHYLVPWDTMVPGNYSSIPASTANKSGQTWTDLKGKTLALGKMQGEKWAIYWSTQRTVTITTAYTGYHITLMTSGAGTATLAATSLLRGESTTLTVTPASGYKIDHVDVSHGTIVRNSVNVFTFTMPTPGEATTITVYFKPFTARAKVGGIIYADWYNQ